MNTPIAPAPAPTNVHTLQIPAASYPITNRVISTAPMPLDPPAPNVPAAQHLMWEIGKKHPLLPTADIIRMFSVPGESVEVYSKHDMKEGGSVGMRNTIPWHSVRLVEEIMPGDVFIEELTEAEDARDEVDEPEAPTGMQTKLSNLVPINGG